MTHDRSVVLIITCPIDSHADRAILEIEDRGYQVLRFHPEDMAEQGKVSVEYNSGVSSISFGKRQVRFDQIKSCWYRKPQAIKLPPMGSQAETEFARKELAQTFYGIVRTLDCFWMSYPAFMQEASWKPLQLRVAANFGMTIPATYIGNNAVKIKEFYQQYAGKIIYKTLHSPVISEASMCFTSIVTERHMSELNSIAWTGGIFQELVMKKSDLRIIAIQDDLYSFEIDSQSAAISAVDWRHGDPHQLNHTIHTITDDLEKKIIRYMRHFRLNYGAFDFVLTPKNEYVFLECNPGGQYGWLEAFTGVPLTEKIVDRLVA